jgi:hypothetical protein
MSKKKIVDLAQYRKTKSKTDKNPDPSNKGNLSFEEKLQDFYLRPIAEPGSKEELIAIFEEEQLKKDREEEEG